MIILEDLPLNIQSKLHFRFFKRYLIKFVQIQLSGMNFYLTYRYFYSDSEHILKSSKKSNIPINDLIRKSLLKFIIII